MSFHQAAQSSPYGAALDTESNRPVPQNADNVAVMEAMYLTVARGVPVNAKQLAELAVSALDAVSVTEAFGVNACMLGVCRYNHSLVIVKEKVIVDSRDNGRGGGGASIWLEAVAQEVLDAVKKADIVFVDTARSDDHSGGGGNESEWKAHEVLPMSKATFGTCLTLSFPGSPPLVLGVVAVSGTGPLGYPPYSSAASSSSFSSFSSSSSSSSSHGGSFDATLPLRPAVNSRALVPYVPEASSHIAHPRVALIYVNPINRHLHVAVFIDAHSGARAAASFFSDAVTMRASTGHEGSGQPMSPSSWPSSVASSLALSAAAFSSSSSSSSHSMASSSLSAVLREGQGEVRSLRLIKSDYGHEMALSLTDVMPRARKYREGKAASAVRSAAKMEDHRGVSDHERTLRAQLDKVKGELRLNLARLEAVQTTIADKQATLARDLLHYAEEKAKALEAAEVEETKERELRSRTEQRTRQRRQAAEAAEASEREELRRKKEKEREEAERRERERVRERERELERERRLRQEREEQEREQEQERRRREEVERMKRKEEEVEKEKEEMERLRRYRQEKEEEETQTRRQWQEEEDRKRRLVIDTVEERERELHRGRAEEEEESKSRKENSEKLTTTTTTTTTMDKEEENRQRQLLALKREEEERHRLRDKELAATSTASTTRTSSSSSSSPTTWNPSSKLYNSGTSILSSLGVYSAASTTYPGDCGVRSDLSLSLLSSPPSSSFSLSSFPPSSSSSTTTTTTTTTSSSSSSCVHKRSPLLNSTFEELANQYSSDELSSKRATDETMVDDSSGEPLSPTPLLAPNSGTIPAPVLPHDSDGMGMSTCSRDSEGPRVPRSTVRTLAAPSTLTPRFHDSSRGAGSSSLAVTPVVPRLITAPAGAGKPSFILCSVCHYQRANLLALSGCTHHVCLRCLRVHLDKNNSCIVPYKCPEYRDSMKKCPGRAHAIDIKYFVRALPEDDRKVEILKRNLMRAYKM